MKTIFCSGCSIKVAEIANGSKLKNGLVMLCSICETKRIASDMAKKTSPSNGLDAFSEMFGGGKNKPFWQS